MKCHANCPKENRLVIPLHLRAGSLSLSGGETDLASDLVSSLGRPEVTCSAVTGAWGVERRSAASGRLDVWTSRGLRATRAEAAGKVHSGVAKDRDPNSAVDSPSNNRCALNIRCSRLGGPGFLLTNHSFGTCGGQRLL